MIPLVTTALGATGGYFLKWHEPYWFMSVFIAFLGLLSGIICSAALLLIRGIPVLVSLRLYEVQPTDPKQYDELAH